MWIYGGKPTISLWTIVRVRFPMIMCLVPTDLCQRPISFGMAMWMIDVVADYRDDVL
jgi:hypothetical protein